MIISWKAKDGKYQLSDHPDHKRSTYKNRVKIKELGGKWSTMEQKWIVDENCVNKIKAIRKYVCVIESYCHMPSGFAIVTPVEMGFRKASNQFCSRCDSRYGDVPIIECLGEGAEGIEK